MIGAIVAGGLSAMTPPVTSSYESIATANGTGSSTVITFSSIPSDYKHLQIRWIGRSTGVNSSIYLRFNGDTASNYSYHELQGDGSSATAAAAASLNFIYVGQVFNTTSTFGAGVIDVLDYTSVNKNKTIRSLTGRDQNGSGAIFLQSGAWFNSSTAVNSITITSNGGNLDSNSSFALYGIKG